MQYGQSTEMFAMVKFLKDVSGDAADIANIFDAILQRYLQSSEAERIDLVGALASDFAISAVKQRMMKC